MADTPFSGSEALMAKAPGQTDVPTQMEAPMEQTAEADQVQTSPSAGPDEAQPGEAASESSPETPLEKAPGGCRTWTLGSGRKGEPEEAPPVQ